MKSNLIQKNILLGMILTQVLGCGRYHGDITQDAIPSQVQKTQVAPEKGAETQVTDADVMPLLPPSSLSYVEPLVIPGESQQQKLAEGQREPAVEKKQDYDIVEEGKTSPTVYFNEIIYENEMNCAESEKKDLHGAKGVVLMKACQTTLDRCGLQGSCTVVQNNKIYRLNILTQVRGQDRFFEIPSGGCIFGYGVDSICLDPFYTLAADMKIYKPGDVIFIPAAVGLELPNNQKHSGYFVIRDQGRGIVGKGRFDFFSGYYSWRDERNPLLKLKLHDVNTKLTYYKISGDRAKLVLTSRAFPMIPQTK